MAFHLASADLRQCLPQARPSYVDTIGGRAAMAVTPDQQQPPPPAGASSTPPRLRVHVHETTLVPPSPSPPETSLPLTFLDVFFLHSTPVKRLFLYRLAGPDADVAAIISNLRDSLHQALRAFYPLAGRVCLTPGTTDRYELHYRPGDAVTFTVAECDADDDDMHFDGLTTDEPREVAKIATLVPPLPDGGRLLAVQATLLPARRGLAIGVTVHHAACDGSGSTHFLHTWAAACRGGAAEPPMPPPPVIDRTLLPDPRRLYDVFVQAAPSSQELEFIKVSADQLLATFVLSKDDLTRVKDVVADEATRRGVAPPRCSSLVATFGFVWSCYQRAKNGGGGAGEGPMMTCMVIAVDHRSRMKPPLPDKYLGNCVGPAFALAPTGDLAVAGAGGLFSACAAVAASIDEAVRDIGTSRMEAWMDRIKEVLLMDFTHRVRLAEVPRLRPGLRIRPTGEGGGRARDEDRRSGGGGEPGWGRRDRGGGLSPAGCHGELQEVLRGCYRVAAPEEMRATTRSKSAQKRVFYAIFLSL